MIGVIGGNGVAATNRLCALVEEKMTNSGAYRDAHHPEMIIWQATQVPSRYTRLCKCGQETESLWLYGIVHVLQHCALCHRRA